MAKKREFDALVKDALAALVQMNDMYKVDDYACIEEFTNEEWAVAVDFMAWWFDYLEPADDGTLHESFKCGYINGGIVYTVPEVI